LAASINFPAKLGAAAKDWFAAAKKEYNEKDEANVINVMIA